MSRSFKDHLPEDDHNRWPKHVAGCTECNKSTYLYEHLLVISHKKSSVQVMNHFKKYIIHVYSLRKAMVWLSENLRSCDRAS